MVSKKRLRKRHKERKKITEIITPSPVKLPPVKLFSFPFLRRLAVFLAVVFIAALITLLVFNKVNKINEKKELENKLLSYDKAINGTQIQITKDSIENLVASGTMPVPKEEVLSERVMDYICTLTTDKGVITLKKRGSLIREEVMREGQNLSVIFLEDKLYMYHPAYDVWAMFSYDENQPTSDHDLMKMAFSMYDLRAINESEYLCIETELPDEEFSLGDKKVIGALAFLDSIRYLR